MCDMFIQGVLAEVLIDSGVFKKLLTVRKDFKKTDETLKTHIQ